MELISREQAIKYATQAHISGCVQQRIVDLLKSVPTVENRPKGWWTDSEENKERIKSKYCGYCSICGGWSEYLTDFCGNCGADMRGEE